MRRYLIAAVLLVACGGSAAIDSVPPPIAPPDDDGGVTLDAGRDGDLPKEAAAEASTGPVSLVVEPSDKANALLAAVKAAKNSIHVTMYLLDDSRFIAAFVERKKAGVDVRVILNQTFPANAGDNTSAFSTLQAGGVDVAWSPAGFKLTHEKCVMIDAAQAWIMTMNLETTSSNNREYLVIDSRPSDVEEAESIFAADFAGKAITPTGSLLVSPVNARPGLVTLIASAKQSVDVEGEELSDTQIVGALETANTAGVAVRIVLENDGSPSPAQSAAVSQLLAAHIPVVGLSKPYVHAKAIVVDGARAYVGSENFTSASLLDNRELGLILDDATSVGVVAATIAKDFAAGKSF